jgi:hypothetical protein
MRQSIFLGASLGVALLCGYAAGGESLKSGPQVGDAVTPFHPINILNVDRPQLNGKKNCLV